MRNHAGGKLFKGPVKEPKMRIITNLEMELVAKVPPVLMRIKMLDVDDVTLFDRKPARSLRCPNHWGRESCPC